LFGRVAFAAQAGSEAEGALFPWVGEPTREFRLRFAERFGRQPDYAAACAYDSIRIVVAAIRKSGLNRVRIRDAIAAGTPYEGVSGHIEWDEFGQNRRPPLLGVIRSGQAGLASLR
jgi:branched-chain amino acid transport system substrate-binding protein